MSNKMQHYTVYFIWKLLYMFRVVPPPIIRSAYNCIYSIWYLSDRYCYLPLSLKSWNWFECAVGGVGCGWRWLWVALAVGGVTPPTARSNQNQDQDGTAFHPDPACKLSANLYDTYLLLCVQWKTTDDGQRKCLKHVEFHSENKFEKLVHLVGFIIGKD
jgi:hypothetical protein